MENLSISSDSAPCLPARELWGRQVLGCDGTTLGTIDSVVHTVGGPTRAILRTGRRHHRFILVDISMAALQDEVVVVES